MFEDKVKQQIFSGKAEKTFVDKILDRQDVEKIKELMNKDPLTRKELLELLYLCSSVELKLLNYSDWDRYLMSKFFVWVREFVSITEQVYDYEDDLKKKEAEKKETLTPRTKQIFNNCKRKMEHNIKFLIDFYFNLSRSTMSLGATGFLEILKQKYELVYPQQGVTTETKDKKWGLTK